MQLVVRSDDFRGYAGRVAAGAVARGDEVVALPSGRRSTIAEIHTYDGALDAALAGDSVTLRLADDIDLARGDVLAHAGQAPRLAKALDVTLCWLDEAPLAPAARYLARIGTRTVPASVAAVEHRLDLQTLRETAVDAPLAMNEIARARISIAQAVAIDPYAAIRGTGSLILVDPVTNRTVAAGLVT